jgi:hypothetical protein
MRTASRLQKSVSLAGVTNISAEISASTGDPDNTPTSEYEVAADSFIDLNTYYLNLSQHAQAQVSNTLTIQADAGDDPNAPVLVTITIGESLDDPSQGSVTASGGSYTQPGTYQYKAKFGDTIPLQVSTSVDAGSGDTNSPGHAHGSVVVSVEQLPTGSVWTGNGPDDLWSDGANWEAGIAPAAGDDLQFPEGAQQLANVNDLGYSFGSVTIQDSYIFSGQPLTVDGALDVQQGSTELDCSTTLAGTSTIEQGASLAIGSGQTLDVLSSDPFNDKGNLSLLSNSKCNIDGDASVGNGATFSAAADCSAAINGNFSLLGKETFDKNTSLTFAESGDFSAAASGTLDYAGTANFLGKTTLAKGSSFLAEGESNTVINASFQTAGNTQFDPRSILTYNAQAHVEVAGGGSFTSAGHLTANAKSVFDIDFGAGLTVPAGTADLYGAVNSMGTCQLGLGANMISHDGSVFNLNSEFDCNGGKLTLQAGKTPKDGPQWFLSSTALFFEKSGQFVIGVTDLVKGFGTIKIAGGVFVNQGKTTDSVIKDGDAITVAGGGLMDVTGSLTEYAGGHLDVFGTVIVEPGTTLDTFTRITVERGGVIDVRGTFSIHPGGSLDDFGTVTVESGAVCTDQGVVTVEPGGVFQRPGAQGDIARLIFLTQPGTVSANGRTTPFQVLALDQFGNRLNGVIVTLMVVPVMAHGVPSAIVASTVQAVAINGVATFTQPAIALRGRYRLMADVGGAPVFSEPFTVGLFGRLS